jgi:NADH-ubiquinone oxidoreductase chain 1
MFCHLVFFLFVISLAETNRSPFDFAEGESELVSGYNVEFSGSGFLVLFLSEYLSILFMSTLVSALGTGFHFRACVFFAVCFAFLFIWVRGRLPRFRYDQLMGLC